MDGNGKKKSEGLGEASHQIVVFLINLSSYMNSEAIIFQVQHT